MTVHEVTIAGIRVEIPSKCAGAEAPGLPAVRCTAPGTLPRCMLCPDSPNYHLRKSA